MMPTIEYFLVCRSVQEDITTNEMSVVSILEDISPESFPHVIPSAFAVSLWNLRPGEVTEDYQATVVVKTPGRRPEQFPMNFSHGTHRCRAIQRRFSRPLELA